MCYFSKPTHSVKLPKQKFSVSQQTMSRHVQLATCVKFLLSERTVPTYSTRGLAFHSAVSYPIILETAQHSSDSLSQLVNTGERWNLHGAAISDCKDCKESSDYIYCKAGCPLSHWLPLDTHHTHSFRLETPCVTKIGKPMQVCLWVTQHWNRDMERWSGLTECVLTGSSLWYQASTESPAYRKRCKDWNWLGFHLGFI